MTKHKRPSPRDTGRHDTKANAEDVASLINERRKYEDWIAALEAKRDVTPAHVFTRVHADYETRLRAIVDKLQDNRRAPLVLEAEEDNLAFSHRQAKGTRRETTNACDRARVADSPR